MRGVLTGRRSHLERDEPLPPGATIAWTDGPWDMTGLEHAVPLAQQLPAVFQDDEFAMRFVSAFDVALAPIVLTLDNLAGYVEPWLAPDDFLEWVGSWLGVEVSRKWDLRTRRAVVANAVAAIRRTGTVRCVVEALTLATGGDVDVSESGGTSWSRTPGSALPGEATATMHVRIRVDDPGGVDLRAVDRLVTATKPAHVQHSVEVVAK